MIRLEDGKYTVYSGDGKRRFGTYDSKARAERRLAQIEQYSKVEPNEVRAGDFVMWNAARGYSSGRVEHVMTSGVLGLRDQYGMTATPDNPAALIRLYRPSNGGFEATKLFVAHRFSALTKIEPLNKMQPTMGQVHVPTTDRRKRPVYKQESYKPTVAVARAAQRALNWIADGKAGSGFTDVGRARAAQLANRNPVSLDTAKRMSSFFARHAVDRDASGFRLGEKGYPSAGRVAWDAWGGDAGRSWANAIVARAERQVKKQEGCPVATQDVAVNLKNRQVAIETANYGPLDPNEPNDLYWQERAEVFDTTPDQAKSSRCGNCAAFDVTAQIKECIAEGIGDEGDPYDVIDAGDLGYCRVFKFKCAAARTCDAWIAGGPIADKQMHPEGEVEGGDVKVEINVHQMPMKNDEDRPLMRYGSAPMLTLRKADERKYTLGPLYMPNKVDAHGEFTDENELQGAVWEYVRKGDRRIRLQHNRDVVAGEWVEVMTWPYEMTVETAMADGTVQKSEYPANTVFLGVVWKDWAWNLVKEGRVRGYSIGGKAERISVDMDKSVELLAKATKTEDGVEYPREAFAYAPDPERPSGWKLRLWDDLESKVTPRQLGRAVAALGPGGFRGNRVQIPADDLGDVKAKIRAAWRATYGEERAIPRAIA